MTDFEKELSSAAHHIWNKGRDSNGNITEDLERVRAAYEARVAEIIGSDEPDPTQVTHSDDGSTTITLPTGELDRNQLRAEQRSRAKLPEEGSKNEKM